VSDEVPAARVLVVDDNEAGRYATARTLRQAGFAVVEGASGSEALRLAPGVDLVVLDVNLPDINGFEVCSRLRRAPATAGLPIVHLSATYVRPDDRLSGLEAGADAYLTQPVDPRELVATVRALLRLSRAEQELGRQRSLVTALVRASSDAIYVKDLEGRYLLFNPTAERVTGKAADEVLGRDDSVLFPPDEAAAIVAFDREVLAGGQPVVFEETVAVAGGEKRTFLTTKGPLLDEQGRPFALYGMARDITERKRAEEAVRRSQEQYARFIDATDDVAFIKGADLRYLMVNAAGAAFYGRSPEDVVGRRDEELLPPEAAEACRQSDLLALRENRLVVVDERVGDRVFEVRKFPLELVDGGVGVGGFIRDVTERRQAEASARGLAAELERRVRERTRQLEFANAELEAFVYAVSHDLRAPLRALDGFSQIVIEDYADRLDEAGRQHLQRIRGAAQRMAMLLDDLLELSRMTRRELRRERVDLSALATEIVEELQSQEPGRRVACRIAPGLSAEADPHLARVVLQNLLANAWKFTAPREQAVVEVGAERRGDETAFYVRDNGVGFDMAYAHKLFMPFQRLHDPAEFPGTGVGLATVRRIVHRHGGRTWAEGRPDEGATFWFTLPSAARDAVAGAG